ncbi:S1 family peptidase [Halomicrobium urmianum]|uniref:S1 family peptidase n=1 Tax=Halomicrobium urmianum TaxID=1586233 RepID=UPI001CD9EC80|nr:serine protease [Halomicrobium urmianum]
MSDAETDATPDAEASREELREKIQQQRERIAALEARLDERATRIDELESRLEDGEGEEADGGGGDAGAAGFDASTLERAEGLVDRVRKSVVVSVVDRDRGRSTGTAWFVDDRTLVSTGHGASEADRLTCWRPDGTSFEARPVDSIHGEFHGHPHVDLSVLAADADGRPLPTGSASSLSRDQPLLQVGHPNFVGNWIPSLGRFVDTHDFYGLRSTVPTLSGNSGSPLVTLDGTAVGLTTGEAPREQSHDRGEAPSVGPADIRTSFADASYATHVPGDVVEAFVEQP